MVNDTWWDIVDRLSMTDINRYLGYTAQEESDFTQRSLEEIKQERLDISQMPAYKATDYLDKKMTRLSVMTTTAAAEHYGISTNSILDMVRRYQLPAFKPEHKHWRVWVNPSSKEFLKMPQHKKTPV